MSSDTTDRPGLLSRIAETLFWTGRYIERADDTARMVDVYVHRMLVEPQADEDAGCSALLGALGMRGERVDMTARMLLARMPAAPYELDWQMLLHACGAYESFIRVRSGVVGSRHVADFLILDRLFPRSVLHALATAEECLAALEAGMGESARRPIGRMRTRLEYADPQLPPDQLPELLSALQQTCLEASEAI